MPASPPRSAPRRTTASGTQPLTEKLTPAVVRLRKAEPPPAEDQKGLLALVDALLARRGVA